MTDQKDIVKPRTPVLVATDLDGTYGRKVSPAPPSAPTLCISGRTFSEYNAEAKIVANQMPLYIRGYGKYGDANAAGHFKARMIRELGVTHFLEDDPIQAGIIRQECPGVEVLMVVVE